MQRHVKIILHGIDLKTDPSKVNVSYEIVFNQELNDKVLNLNASFKTPPERPTFRLIAQLRANASKESVGKTVYDRRKELCVVLTNPSDHQQFLTLYDHIRDYSNLPHTCPINQTFIWMRRFQMSRGTFPSWFPKSFFTVTIILYEKGTDDVKASLFKAKMYVEISKI